MRIGINYGLDRVELEVADDRLIAVQRQPAAPALANPPAAVRAALENPLGFPALRRALTPDDHVTIVVDEYLPRLADLLAPILEHLSQAQVATEAITLLCPPSASRQEWLDDLPDAFEEVRLEIHDPTDRKRMSYLATMRRGRRLYLNRTAVDADQVVVLTGRGFDPLLGYSGAEGALFPALSDEATRQEMCGRLSMALPGATPWPVREEAIEAGWLLGAPFLVQIIEGAGDEIIHVVGGLRETGAEGQRLLDARWRVRAADRAALVVAGLSGAPGRQTFGDLARAAACAARVVQPGGRIVLLSQARPALGPGAALLRQAEDPDAALALLSGQTLADIGAAFQWAHAAKQAQIFLLSGLPPESVEELFAVPLEQAGQVQRPIQAAESCLILDDAHKTLAQIA